MRTNPDIPDTISIAVTVAIFLVILATGVVVFQAVKAGVDGGTGGLEQRADVRYGDSGRVVVSDVCYEMCSMTAVNETARREAILRVADRRDGWVSGFTLGTGVAGTSPRQSANALVEQGLLVKRDVPPWEGDTEYRYVGPDGAYADKLTDAELRVRISAQLWGTERWMYPDEVTQSVPAAEWRVRKELRTMAHEGQIQAQREDANALLMKGRTVYAHPSVTHAPHRGGGVWPDGVGGVFLIAAIVGAIIAVIHRFRPNESG